MVNHFSENDPVKIALVGLGNVGARYDLTNPIAQLTHASAISLNSRFTLVGACDSDPKFRKDFEKVYNVPTFDKLSDLLEFDLPTIVVVATSTDSHVQVLEELVSCPDLRFVLCEKPIARKSDNIEPILRRAHARGQKILVNYQRRTELASRSIYNLILQGEFGRFRGGAGYYSGGFFNNGSHMIDLLEWWLSDKFESKIVFELCSEQDDWRVSAIGELNRQKFCLKSIHSPSTFLFEIFLQFENCQIRYCSGGSQIFIDWFVQNKDFRSFKSLQVSTQSINVGSGQSFASIYDEIFVAIHGSNTTLPTALESLDLIERMSASVEGGVIELC